MARPVSRPHPHTATTGGWQGMVGERAASHWALNTLKFQPNAHFAVLWNLLFPSLRLQTNSWKYNLVEHLYGKNVSHFPHGPVVVIRPPPSHAHFDSTLDESRVSWLHIRMSPTMATWTSLGVTGNLEPKTHRVCDKNGTCSDLITKGAPILQSPICWKALLLVDNIRV